MNRFMSEKIRATVEPKRWIFPVVAVCLLLIGMSVVVWSELEISKLVYLNRQCDVVHLPVVVTGVGNVRSASFFETIVCLYSVAFLRIVGIVLSSIGVGILLLLVFFRLRMPIARTPA